MILKKVPLRKCIVCGIQKPKYEFLVVVRPPKNSNEKMKVIDGSTKKEGRGAYFCKNKKCWYRNIIVYNVCRDDDFWT